MDVSISLSAVCDHCLPSQLPYFMNELTLTELDMGVSTPRILQASKPSVDHQGIFRKPIKTSALFKLPVDL